MEMAIHLFSLLWEEKDFRMVLIGIPVFVLIIKYPQYVKFYGAITKEGINLSPRKIDAPETQLIKLLAILGLIFSIVGLLCMIYRAFLKL